MRRQYTIPSSSPKNTWYLMYCSYVELMIVQQLKIQIVLYLHILISQPIIRLIGSTEEYAYDTLPHGICQFNVSVAYCIEYLNEKKDQLLGKKRFVIKTGRTQKITSCDFGVYLKILIPWEDKRKFLGESFEIEWGLLISILYLTFKTLITSIFYTNYS